MERRLPVGTCLIDLWFGFLRPPPVAPDAASRRPSASGALFIGSSSHIIVPCWCLVSQHRAALVGLFSKFPGVTWQLLEYGESLCTPSHFLPAFVPDLISAQALTYTIFTLTSFKGRCAAHPHFTDVETEALAGSK